MKLARDKHWNAECSLYTHTHTHIKRCTPSHTTIVYTIRATQHTWMMTNAWQTTTLTWPTTTTTTSSVSVVHSELSVQFVSHRRHFGAQEFQHGRPSEPLEDGGRRQASKPKSTETTTAHEIFNKLTYTHDMGPFSALGLARTLVALTNGECLGAYAMWCGCVCVCDWQQYFSCCC